MVTSISGTKDQHKSSPTRFNDLRGIERPGAEIVDASSCTQSESFLFHFGKTADDYGDPDHAPTASILSIPRRIVPVGGT